MLEIACASLYFNYLITANGHCISLDYMIPIPKAPATSPPPPPSGNFPDWLIHGTGAERDQYQKKVTIFGILWESRWLESLEEDRLNYLDCATGDRLTRLEAGRIYTEPVQDQSAVIKDAGRLDCQLAGASRVF